MGPPYNWEYYENKTTYLFDRGYTGHEHMDKFDLINMPARRSDSAGGNGRCYDPSLPAGTVVKAVHGRMLSPDPFVQSPTYSQNFNRYSYAFNNPLKYTDPSGYIEKPIIHENRYSAGGGGGNYFGSNMYFGNPFSGGGAGTNGFYYYSSATGGYMYGQAGFAGGTQVSYGEVYNNYVVPNATYSVTGYSAQSLFSNITSGFNLYEVQAFGQTTLVSAFGPLGSTNVSSNGGISFSNLTASAHAGEVVVGSDGWGIYSIDNAVNWLNDNAHSSWKDAKGQCAKYIRWSLEAGFGLEKDAFLGKTPVPARQYGPFLEGKGFQTVNTTNYLKGDVSVIQGYPGATADGNGIPYGHIQMYNGSIWISDFKQLRDFWPGSGYRTNQPAFIIYRWGN